MMQLHKTTQQQSAKYALLTILNITAKSHKLCLLHLGSAIFFHCLVNNLKWCILQKYRLISFCNLKNETPLQKYRIYACSNHKKLEELLGQKLIPNVYNLAPSW